MANMEELRMASRVAHTLYETQHKALEDALDAEEVCPIEVEANFRLLRDIYGDYQDANAHVYAKMLTDGTTSEVARQAELESHRLHNVKHLRLKIRAEKFLMPDNDRSNNASFSSNNSQAQQQHPLRLPKVELPKFGGDLKKWLGWWSQFKQIDEDDRISITNKFHYLLQHLEPNSEAHQLVSKFPPTQEHYKSAKDALEERFGRHDLLLQVYLRELLSLVISNATSKDKMPVAQLHVQLDSHLRALKELKLSEAGPDTWLFPLVESSLSEATLRAWQRSDLGKSSIINADPTKSRLQSLMEFLQMEVRCEQQIALAQSGFQLKEESSPKKRINRRVQFAEEENLGTSAGLFTGTKGSEKASCVFCDKNHHSDRCINAQKLTLDERRKLVEKKRLCFICLSGKHIAKKCTAAVKCVVCGRKHYPIMCPGTETVAKKPDQRSGSNMVGVRPDKEEDDNSSESYQANTSLQCSREILLNTFIVDLECNGGRTIKVRLVADSGSQRSWIKKKLVESSSSKRIGEELIQCCLFGGNVTQSMKHGRYSVLLKHPETGEAVKLELLEKGQICSNIPKIPQGPWIKELANRGIILSDVGKGYADIDILIGSDYWGMIQTGRVVKLKGGLVATETVLGWTLSGPIGEKVGTTYLNMLTTTQDLSQLWSLEALGIRDPIEQKSVEEEEKEALKIFASTVTREEDGRYCVALPWKMDPDDLPTNYYICEKRLQSTTNKLVKQEKVGAYNGVIQNWNDQEIISKLVEDDKLGHYLSHHPVFKDSVTTPVRPVFNASLKVGRYPSLNNCLFTGPNLIELLIAVVLRFREKKIGISADICKAFLQILIRLLDRNYLKFLWWEEPGNPNSRIIIFMHNRVVFGMTCSPFLLLAVIIAHINGSAEKADFKEKLIKAFYCDNCATSVDGIEDYESFQKRAINLMADAKMDLREWQRTLLDGEPVPEQKIANILGMEWDLKEDTLACVVKDFPIPEKVTKRMILSVTAQVFDPIGVLAPAMIVPKKMIQEVWALKCGWDEEVPEEVGKRFRKWMGEIKSLSEIRIPRHFQLYNATTIEVHAFCDASQHAYAGAVFMRTGVGEDVKVQLLMAKARLAPLKKVKKDGDKEIAKTDGTIPRKELMSCLLVVRLVQTVRKALGLEDVETYFHTDSGTCYTWIRRQAEYGVFVRNRVNEIRKFTKTEQWRHVSGVNNPADLPSRGCNPSQLLKSVWWEGPEWLAKEKEEWPKSSIVINEEEVQRELLPVRIMASAATVSQPRFSSYYKTLGVMGWVIRFINMKCRRIPPPSKHLTEEELRQAEKVILREVQAECFPLKGEQFKNKVIYEDEDGLLRLKTRLLNRDDEEYFKFPILLPKYHPVVDQLVREFHEFHAHNGVNYMISKLREKYWIVQCKRVVRRIIKECKICQRYRAQPLETEPVALPRKRVQCSRPFDTTGVDLAGPVQLQDNSKVWIVIYTCAVYRCVHLDLVTTLETVAILMSMERFLGIYGRPRTIWSDHGTNFVGADNLFKLVDENRLECEAQLKRIKWVFNPKTASWWGGFFERLIRTVKDLLKRIVGRAKLSHDELLTCLSGVAATINDRPLTVMGENSEDLIPLTPGMFLRFEGNAHFPDLIGEDDLQQDYQKMKEIQAQLQARFRKEYLGNLLMTKKTPQKRDVKVGDVVLVGYDNKKRYLWPLGIVRELVVGKDSHVRLVRVKTAKGMDLRPVQRIYPLELSCVEDWQLTEKERQEIALKAKGKKKVVKDKPLPTTTSAPAPSEPTITRIGRESKKPIRYGQWIHLVK